ncbi:MAG: hypothetical protein IPN11_11100 [Opitutaceae bacterium]|nr:hypothetical protein [Opitutaceae bacterium]
MTSVPAPTSSPSVTVRDLGVPVKAVSWVRLHPGRGPDGKASLLATMGQNNGGLFALDIDLATGHCRQLNAKSAVQQYPISAFRSPRTGLLYIGTHTDGHLLRYDPAQPERGLEDLGVIDGDQAIFPTGITEAPDGTLWIGGYPGCTFTQYDPATGEFRRLGSVDPEDKYLYPLSGCDGSLAALTKFTHPHIVAVDPATGERKTLGPVLNPEDKSQRILFYKGLDGRLYLETHEGNFRISGLALEPVTYLPPAMPGIHATYKHSYQEVLPMPEGLLAAWADGEEGAGIYKHLLLTSTNPTVAPRTLALDWEGGGSNIFMLHPGADGNIYGSSFLPEHLFRYNPATGEMANLGRCSVSMGEAYTMGNFSDGTIAIASYPHSRVSLYDPKKPYRFGTDESANPRDIGRLDQIGIRPAGMAIVPQLTRADGTVVPEKMWIASLPDYGLWGGTLAWLDPKTGAHASHRHLVPDCSPFSLLWLPESKLLLVGLSTEGGTGTQIKARNGAFVLWDPIEDRAVYTGDFGLKDLPSIQALAPAGPGRVYAQLSHSRFAANTMGAEKTRPRLALIDVAARQAVAESSLPDDYGVMSDQAQFCVFPGPDGVYGRTEHVLYRIKPGTCDTEVVHRLAAGDGFEATGPWIGRTFYFGSAWRLRALTLPE